MDNFSSSINKHKFRDLDNIGPEDDWYICGKDATLIPLETMLFKTNKSRPRRFADGGKL